MKRNKFIVQNSIDSEIFLEYKKIKRPLLINSLLGIKHYTKEDCTGAIIAIKELIATVSKSNLQKLIKSAYKRKLRKEILKQKLLISSIEDKDKKSFKLSSKIYTKPQKDIFKHVCHRYEKLVLNKISSVSNLSKEEKNFIEKIRLLSENKLKRPKQKKFKAVQEMYKEKINDLDFIEEKRLYSVEEIKTTIKNYIEQKGWNYRTRISSIPNFFIDLKKRILYVPNESLSGSNLKKVLLHEVICHLQRRDNGKNSKLQLLGVGTAEYEFFEEGLAKLFEQLHKKKFHDYGGLEKYFAICVVRGMFDGEKKNKEELEEIMYIFYKLFFSICRKDEGVENKAKTRSKKLVQRIFRGFSGKTKGCCFTKDLIYRESNILIWNKLIDEGSFDLDFVMKGKFSLFDEEDVELVKNFL